MLPEEEKLLDEKEMALLHASNKNIIKALNKLFHNLVVRDRKTIANWTEDNKLLLLGRIMGRLELGEVIKDKLSTIGQVVEQKAREDKKPNV